MNKWRFKKNKLATFDIDVFEETLRSRQHARPFPAPIKTKPISLLDLTFFD